MKISIAITLLFYTLFYIFLIPLHQQILLIPHLLETPFCDAKSSLLKKNLYLQKCSVTSICIHTQSVHKSPIPAPPLPHSPAPLSRKQSQRSVTFASGDSPRESLSDSVSPTKSTAEIGIQTLPPEQEQVLVSIRSMLRREEEDMEESQQKALNVVRAALLTQDAVVQTDDYTPPATEITELKTRTMTIFTLASHISNESVMLGIEPSSLFKTFATLHSKLISDLEDKAMSFVLPQTPKVPQEMLRVLTREDMSIKHEVRLLSHLSLVCFNLVSLCFIYDIFLLIYDWCI